MNSVDQRRGEVQAELETVRKKMTELEARQADLKGTLMRLNLYSQVRARASPAAPPVASSLATRASLL